MGKVWAILLGLVLFFVGSSLQGCGCDEDEAKKCFTTKVAEMTGKTEKGAICDGLKAAIACIVDASCCDLEADGKTMKDAIKALIDTLGKTNSCDVKGCE